MAVMKRIKRSRRTGFYCESRGDGTAYIRQYRHGLKCNKPVHPDPMPIEEAAALAKLLNAAEEE